MTIWNIDIIVCAILIVLAIILHKPLFNIAMAARAKRFSDRAELSPDEFYRQYYYSSGLPKDQVIEILNDISRALAIPAALIRPTDRFTEELMFEPDWAFESELDCLAMDLDALSQERCPGYPMPDIKDVDEYIRFIIELGGK
ncbi:MAG: hypothetical protein HQK99_03255 [Nitrospirae bacterium]|nr:hypothetical protein [Nitrospirota bacterium]